MEVRKSVRIRDGSMEVRTREVWMYGSLDVCMSGLGMD